MMTLIRKSKNRYSSVLLCFVFAVIIAAGWAGSGCCESAVPEANASGNRNVTLSVDPFKYSESYSAVLYDIRNGLPVSEANAIAQTSDGFLWVGSYAGLSRYDGNTFERVDPSIGISNVRCLFVDSRGVLWIGTNDSGVFLMDKSDVRHWGRNDGLESTSIRAITQESDGTICIGTASGIVMIDADMNMTVLQDDLVGKQTIRDLRRGMDNLIYGLTEDGDLFSMQHGEIVQFIRHDECRITDTVLAICPDPVNPGQLYLGTNDSKVYFGRFDSNFASLGVKDISPLNGVECFEIINQQLWICASNGIGRVDNEGFRSLENVPMNNTVGHVMTDYEGNLWFTSNRQGIMKIVPNRFADLFAQYNLSPAVVNSTCLYGRQLFIGTDNGLIVVENGKQEDRIPLTKAVTASGTEEEIPDLLEYLDGIRIRSIIRDSGGRLWISTWRNCGLICYDRGEIVRFTEEDGLFSDRVRTVCECEDGSILVANTGGVNIIRDGRVVDGYGKEDGIDITDILCVTEGSHHDLILGSDGGGIYVIGSGGLRRIGLDDGLNSEIILRVKRSISHDIYWIVTSNSLAWMTPDYQVTTIRQFPYLNNYDLYENSKGDVLVISSNGIYEVSADELLSGEPVRPLFHGIANGLPYIATANSYSELTPYGDLYIASSTGVVQVNIELPFENINSLKIALPYIDADGKRYFPDENGRFTIPDNVHKLTVYPRIFNYLLVNPQVTYRLEDFDSDDTTVSQRELIPVDYTNLPNGEYRFVIRVEEPTTRTDNTMSFVIAKGKELPAGTAGTLIMISVSLLMAGGILVHTHLRRGGRRLLYKLLVFLILSDFALIAGKLMHCLPECMTISFARELMIAGNTLFYVFFVFFPYLLMIFLDYYTHPDRTRIRKIKLLLGIPCFLCIVAVLINLKTGWLFTVGEENVFRYGPLDKLIFIPVFFYLFLSLARAYKISIPMTVIVALLIIVRIVWTVWYREISSTSFIYTMFLVCIHLYAINRLRDEEAL